MTQIPQKMKHGLRSPKKRRSNPRRYRSGLEKEVAAYLKDNQKQVRYECLKIEWEDLRYRTYTPDFILDNGIIIETKGIFDSEDRRKHLAIREQHPELDIRFIFSNSKRSTRRNNYKYEGPFYFFCHCVSILKHFGNSVEPILKPSSSHFFLAALPDNLLTDFPSIVISSDDLFAKLH